MGWTFYNSSGQRLTTPTAGSDISVRVHNNSAQSISDATVTTILFDSEDGAGFDTDNMHETGSNTERLTAKTAGKYFIHGQITFAAHATGVRQLSICKDGVTTAEFAVVEYHNLTNVAHQTAITAFAELAVDDYVVLKVYQSSGGSLDILGSTNSPEYESVFSMAKILG